MTIGISRTFLSVWGIHQDESAIKSALAELGSRIVKKMIIEKKLRDYLFTTHDYPADYQQGFEGYKRLRDSL